MNASGNPVRHEALRSTLKAPIVALAAILLAILLFLALEAYGSPVMVFLLEGYALCF